MSDPLAELREALRNEYADRPWLAALATSDADGHPHVRSVVTRRIEGSTLWVTSHALSDKNRQVRERPAAELAFWLPNRREQFRVAGPVTFLPVADLPNAWEGLSDSARALFAWPAPGAARVEDPAAFPERLGPGGVPPLAFEVLVVTPKLVERLDLSIHPHRRQRRRASADWIVEELNP